MSLEIEFEGDVIITRIPCCHIAKGRGTTLDESIEDLAVKIQDVLNRYGEKQLYGSAMLLKQQLESNLEKVATTGRGFHSS